MLQIQNTEYAIGTIWDFLNESEIETIKSFYNILIQYKDNKDFLGGQTKCQNSVKRMSKKW